MKLTVDQLRKIISEEVDGEMARMAGRSGPVKKLPKKAGKRFFAKEENLKYADVWWKQLTKKFPNLTSKVDFDGLFEFWDAEMVHVSYPNQQFEDEFIRYLEETL
jgi:hypothetical protein